MLPLKQRPDLLGIIDLRVEYADGFGLARSSNTTPGRRARSATFFTPLMRRSTAARRSVPNW